MIRPFLTSALLGALLGCRSDQPSDAASDASAAKRPIIDMHLHALTFEAWSNGDRPPHPTTGKPPEAKTSADILRLTLEAMDRYNIKLGVLSGPLETVYAWKAKAPDRFLASALFSGRPASDRTAHDPTPSLDSLRREHAAGRLQALGEITSPYEGVDYDGPELAPYFALAARAEDARWRPHGPHLPRGRVYMFPEIPHRARFAAFYLFACRLMLGVRQYVRANRLVKERTWESCAWSAAARTPSRDEQQPSLCWPASF